MRDAHLSELKSVERRSGQEDALRTLSEEFHRYERYYCRCLEVVTAFFACPRQLPFHCQFVFLEVYLSITLRFDAYLHVSLFCLFI